MVSGRAAGRKPGRKRATRAYHHGDLRRALVDAALALEPDTGPLGISLRELARRTGVTHPAVYHHFANKDELVRAVADEGFLRLDEALASVAQAAPEPLARLMALGIAYVRFALRSAPHFRFMFALGARGDPQAAEWHASVRAHFEATAREGQRLRLLGPGNPVRIGARCWSMAHGVASLVVAGALDLGNAGDRKPPTAEARERRALALAQTAMAGSVFGMRPTDRPPYNPRAAPPARPPAVPNE